MMEKNYKTQKMSILRAENGQVPGLVQAHLLQSGSCQEHAAPTPGLPKALQTQVLPFLSRHSSPHSDDLLSNHGLI